MAEDLYPLYSTAVIVPILAFPSWVLCIPPLYWHFSQCNIAAGSLILWMAMINFFTFINPLIWPRDNVLEWWDGNVLCDIQVHIQACIVVAFNSCTAVIARKLARIMDTRNITVAPSKTDRKKEKIFEILWCWGFPLFMMALYYIAQPARYFIFAISGCIAAYDTSWPSIVVSWMWGPITTFVGAFYAGLLIFRLFRYRREFNRLISASNTTKSRFMRLFLMAIIFIVAYLPYSLYILYKLASTVEDPYDWDIVHGPNWNAIIKVPTQGVVYWDKWAQIASGYLFFLLFGTGLDAHNTYKRMLCAVGLGKIFPSLYVVRDSRSPTPPSVTFTKGFVSTCASKAKSLFSKRDSVTETLPGSTCNDSIYLGTSTTNQSEYLQHVPTNEPMLPQGAHVTNLSSTNGSFFSCMFGRRNHQPPVLPMFLMRSADPMGPLKKSPVEPAPSGVHTRAWAAESSAGARHNSDGGVYVVHEVHQAHQKDNGTKKEAHALDWA